ILHVKAKNNDGVWSNEAPFEISVIPPFRDSNWFKLIIVAIIGIGIGVLYWYRRQARIKVEAIRNRIATDLHDDMGSTLSSIRILSDVAKRDVSPQNPRAATMLDKIETDAALLSENMQDIVWTIKTHHNSIGDVVTRMKEYALKIVEAKDISFQTQIAENFKASRLDIAQRRNIYLIFKESINNAVKYSGCSQIQLFITQQNRYLKMVVEDNGCGFDIHTIKKGNGLDNLQKRAVEIKGKVCISSEKGKGTRIDLVVKL
ncbi:MAG: sensor histidine kinase, partial [Flavisolibacter sp.]